MTRGEPRPEPRPAESSTTDDNSSLLKNTPGFRLKLAAATVIPLIVTTPAMFVMVEATFRQHSSAGPRLDVVTFVFCLLICEFVTAVFTLSSLCLVWAIGTPEWIAVVLCRQVLPTALVTMFAGIAVLGLLVWVL